MASSQIVDGATGATEAKGVAPFMRLTPTEKERAQQIKAAVEADDRIQNLSDFDYAQYALTTEQDLSMEPVCERVLWMQCFCQEYKINNTLEQGRELFHQFLQDHPGVFLSIAYLPSSQNYISINDYAAFFPASIKTDAQLRTFFGSMYYVLQCQNPDFEAIRNGICNITECMGASFDNFDPSLMERLVRELYSAYPKNVSDIFFLNSATIGNLTYALCKRFLSWKARQMFFLGRQIPGCFSSSTVEAPRIDQLRDGPCPQVAKHTTMCNFEQYLQLRCSNQANFSLADLD